MNILWLMFGGIITAVEYLIASLLTVSYTHLHDDSSAASTSRIFTRKSSLMSCKTVMNKFAANSISNTCLLYTSFF